jgi:hypothetical protein
LVEPDLQGVLVWVDYTSVVCNMVRDALGHSATCQSLLTQEFEQQVGTCWYNPPSSLLLYLIAH